LTVEKMKNLLQKYFPHLDSEQHRLLDELPALYTEWNSKINVISRKDIEHLQLRHTLHSLAIYRFMPFQAGSDILDIGTGGGFPGIPLAIAMPNVKFHLVDSIGKKIKVVQAVSEALGLKNVRATHARAEEIKDAFDFVVSRAVAELPTLVSWSRGKFKKKEANAIPNGLICLKGGDLREELKAVRGAQVFQVSDYFDEEFFLEKKVIYVPGG